MPFSRRIAFDPSRPPMLLLTGAAHGIGRATARLLGARGFRLGLIDREPAPLDELADELRGRGGAVATPQADVRDREELAEAIGQLEAALGPTDILLACAGVGVISSSTALELDALRLMLEVNVLGVAHAIDAVLPGMYRRGAGHIVGISSVAGFRGMPWMPGYSASKSALTTYLEGLRPGLKRRGVTITTVCPGFVRTRLTEPTPFRRPIPMLEPDQAAAYIVKAVVRRPRDLVFPFHVSIGMRFLRGLPNIAFDFLMDRAGPQALTTEF